MTRKEYKETLNYELFKDFKYNYFKKIRFKYLTPNINCMFLCRKMWYLYSKGRFGKIISKLLYLRIFKKYGCCFFPSANVQKGFFITHPVGIVIGNCNIGENFTIHQNCTVGAKRIGEDTVGLIPNVGNNVQLCSNSLIVGNIDICNNVTIGANSLVLKSIDESGTYVGNPVVKKK